VSSLGWYSTKVEFEILSKSNNYFLIKGLNFLKVEYKDGWCLVDIIQYVDIK